MREGETADHVIVILAGRTRISVMGSDGTNRIVAYRGPGQLVGERAALRVNVRSATVVALEQVEALDVTTAGFAAFLTAHPDVLHLVEEQVYERLTETPAWHQAGGFNHGGPASTAITNQPESGQGQIADHTAGHHPLLKGENCTIVFSDVVAFASPRRRDEQRRIIRREVLDMTSASLKAVWDKCSYEDRGDGLLVVVPPAIPTVQILEYLLIALPIALKRHNGIYADGAQIQLRVAVDVGPVMTDNLGVSGQVIINAARLLEAPTFKAAMAGEHAHLGVVVSDFVYQSAVTQADCLTDPDGYAEIDVRVKEASKRAWMLLVNPPIAVPPRQTTLALATVPSAWDAGRDHDHLPDGRLGVLRVIDLDKLRCQVSWPGQSG